MAEPVRTTGTLNIRPHLRPQPYPERDWVWVIIRRPSGGYQVEMVEPQDVANLCIRGES
jgi:hypothetical protein